MPHHILAKAILHTALAPADNGVQIHHYTEIFRLAKGQ
jgi:hypothetical protein